MQPNIAGLDLLGGLRDFVLSPFSDDDGELDASDISDIQNRYNDQRATNRQKAAELGFDGEYRPNMVTKTDAFEGSVAQLRAKVDKIDLDAVNDLISAWNEISTRNSTSLDEFRKQIARGMAPDVWSGAAATAAAETVAAYDATGKKVTTAAALTRSKLDELRTGLEPTKRLVPFEPEHRSGLDNFGGLFTGRAWRNDNVAQENARVEAVRVLKTVYAPVIHESDTKVPVIPIPKTVENSGGDPGVNGGPTTPISNNPNTSTPVTDQPATNPAAATPAPNTPSDDDTIDDTTDDTTDDATADDDSTTDDDATTPQSTDPAATTPTSATPSPTNPGSGSPSGSPGGGAGAPGSGSPSSPAPGSAVPGAGATTGTTAAGGRAAGAGSGAAGRAGMPGMGAPGARGGGKDDESTKGIPDYLITQEHGDELTGLDNVPKMVPPVIGAD
ncbi:hypothetical protein [Nocardia rhizosphaerihabitans]|uniref:Uncharacterized protein n=1 Tax=Nocardia rhizosphaerihabitans TaxID=1691570 RepID=A0ABQ2L3T4_9NOCA|nr:hypothetical protein [Nocardia rhizosphaerihabitans]GGN99050.1 hypothetical protein GCM10011610_66610 [Nocardia rhizosphaerihabitans]